MVDVTDGDGLHSCARTRRGFVRAGVGVCANLLDGPKTRRGRGGARFFEGICLLKGVLGFGGCPLSGVLIFYDVFVSGVLAFWRARFLACSLSAVLAF